MNSVFFTMSMLINKKSYTHILYNTECLFYEMITSHFAKNYNLQCMKIKSYMITEFDESSNSSVNEVVIVQININSHQKSRIFFYIVFKLAFYNLILVSWVCNETDAQLIISKYKKNTMKRKKRASYRSK